MQQPAVNTPDQPKLTSKEQLFVDYYLGEAHGNAAKAARLAGYSERSVYELARRLLRKVEIQAAIRRFFEQKAMPAEEVLGRLADQGRGAGAYLKATPGGSILIDTEQLLADGKGHLVKAVKQTKFGVDVEFYDAQAALVAIGRSQGLFVDRQESKVDVSVTVYHELTDSELDARISALEGGEAAALPPDGPGGLREDGPQD